MAGGAADDGAETDDGVVFSALSHFLGDQRRRDCLAGDGGIEGLFVNDIKHGSFKQIRFICPSP